MKKVSTKKRFHVGRKYLFPQIPEGSTFRTEVGATFVKLNRDDTSIIATTANCVMISGSEDGGHAGDLFQALVDEKVTYLGSGRYNKI